MLSQLLVNAVGTVTMTFAAVITIAVTTWAFAYVFFFALKSCHFLLNKYFDHILGGDE